MTSKTLCGLLVGTATLVASGLPARADRIAHPTAVFSGLDKITGRIISFEVATNETVQFGSLQITERACYTRPATEAPQTITFAEVDEVDAKKQYKRIFSGWMFAASPGLNGIEHPVYDVWLTDCKGGSDVQKSPAETADADPGKSDAGKSDAGKTDAGKTDTSKAVTGKADTSKTTQKAESGKPRAAKTESAGAEAGKVDAKADPSAVDPSTTEPGTTETAGGGAAQVDTPAPNANTSRAERRRRRAEEAARLAARRRQDADDAGFDSPIPPEDVPRREPDRAPPARSFFPDAAGGRDPGGFY